VLKDFKAFITRGNVVDLAVGVIIGAAVGAIVNSLVSDVIMPPIGIALGEVDFSHFMIIFKHGTTLGPYATIAAAQATGAVTINYGHFIGTIFTFLSPLPPSSFLSLNQ
jgi:large conductance mechanosensitive channel